MADITYIDKVQNAVNPLPVTEQWRAVDANEVKTVVNGKPDELVNYSANAAAYANGDTLQVFADKTKTSIENVADISTAPILGDVTGTLGASVVAKIQGIAVHTTDPTNGQVLQYVSANLRYEPTTPSSGGVTWTDWAASMSLGGFASTSVLQAGYADNGVMITFYWNVVGITNSTAFTFVLPFAPNSASYGASGIFEPIYTVSNVTATTGYIAVTGGSTTATLFTSISAGAFSGTAGHAKSSRGTITFRK